MRPWTVRKLSHGFHICKKGSWLYPSHWLSGWNNLILNCPEEWLAHSKHSTNVFIIITFCVHAMYPKHRNHLEGSWHTHCFPTPPPPDSESGGLGRGLRICICYLTIARACRRGGSLDPILRSTNLLPSQRFQPALWMLYVCRGETECGAGAESRLWKFTKVGWCTHLSTYVSRGP